MFSGCCKHGHKRTEKTTFVRKNGTLECRRCRKQNRRRRSKALKLKTVNKMISDLLETLDELKEQKKYLEEASRNRADYFRSPKRKLYIKLRNGGMPLDQVKLEVAKIMVGVAL